MCQIYPALESGRVPLGSGRVVEESVDRKKIRETEVQAALTFPLLLTGAANRDPNPWLAGCVLCCQEGMMCMKVEKGQEIVVLPVGWGQSEVDLLNSNPNPGAATQRGQHMVNQAQQTEDELEVQVSCRVTGRVTLRSAG